MKSRLLIGFIISLLAGVALYLYLTSTKPCNLPASSSLTAEVFDSSTAILHWAPVTNAQGYQLVVFDSTSIPVFDTFYTQGEFDTVVTVNNREFEHTYIGTLSAQCSEGNTSDNTIQVKWKQLPSLIMEDVVVMLPPPDDGTNPDPWPTCGCRDAFTNIIEAASPPASPLTVFYGLPLGERRVYRMSFNDGAAIQNFKMAFIGGCKTVQAIPCGSGVFHFEPIDLYGGGQGQRISSPTTASNYIEINSVSEVGHEGFSVDFSEGCVGCSFGFVYCLTQTNVVCPPPH